MIGSSIVARGNEMDFSAFVVTFPEGQRANKPYIDLLMAPGEVQEVELEVRNLSNEDNLLILQVATATTSSTGVVSYCPDQVAEPDSTLLFAMEDLITIQEEVVLGPGETKNVVFTIQMPETPFEGILAGGISISPYFDPDELVEVEGMIRNFFAITIPVLLRQVEVEVFPYLQLNSVTAGHRNSRNAVILNLQNIKPMFINEIEAIAHLSREGDTRDVWAMRWEGQIAPNSTFNFYIPLDGERFREGEYRVEIEFIASNGTWAFRESFTLTEEEVEVLNEEALDLREPSLPLWVFLIIGVVILLLLPVITLITIRVMNKRSSHKKQFEVEDLIKKINHEISE
jgi:hypothetical protein